MTKNDFTEAFRQALYEAGLELTKSEAQKAVQAFESTLTANLQDPGDKVRLGIGVFSVYRAKARKSFSTMVPERDRLRFAASAGWKRNNEDRPEGDPAPAAVPAPEAPAPVASEAARMASSGVQVPSLRPSEDA